MIPLADDPLLPQRNWLLEPAFVATRFPSWFPQLGSTYGVRDCAVRRVKYRVHETLRVLYDIDLGDHQETVSVRAFPPGRCQDHIALSHSRHTHIDHIRYDRATAALVFRYPADRKLLALRQIEREPALLDTSLRKRELRLERHAYAPEKCATFSVRTPDDRVISYAKAYLPQEASRAHDLHLRIGTHAARDGRRLRVPRTLGHLTSVGVVLLEPLEGRRLSELRGGQLTASIVLLGATLARFHRLPPPPETFRRHRLKALDRAARVVGLVRPDLAETARRLATTLSTHRAPAAEAVCLHGDLHLKNVLRVGGGVSLIDLDQAAAGPPAADIGGFLAGLRYGVCVRTYDETSAGALTRAFLAGYRMYRRLPADRDIRWHTSAALLTERALRAVNRVRMEGLESLSDILFEAERILGRGGS